MLALVTGPFPASAQGWLDLLVAVALPAKAAPILERLIKEKNENEGR